MNRSTAILITIVIVLLLCISSKAATAAPRTPVRADVRMQTVKPEFQNRAQRSLVVPHRRPNFDPHPVLTEFYGQAKK